LETRRTDKVQEAIEKSGDIEGLLGYTFTLTETIKSKDFRTEVLRLILLVYQNKQTGGHIDFYKIAKCQFALNLPESTALLLEKLLCSEDHEDDYLQAYQIAFDMIEKESQTFVSSVLTHLGNREEQITKKERLPQLKSILKGEIRDRLYLQFLKKNNNTDMLLIGKVKDSIGNRNSMLHASTIWCNGVMNAYTTNDAFIRDNHSWATKATNWNRFSATSSLGMIHMGDKSKAMEILNPYFTGQVADQQSSPYSTAGAYFAYGLIHQNQYSEEVVNFLLDGYRNSGQNEAVQHGVSLGLGLVAMATKDENIYDQLKNVLYNNADSAIIGEAAAYGMGLVMTGSADERAIEEMTTHANDSQHEKIIRALSISLALCMYGKEEQADTLIEQMARSKDAIMRYGAMFAIGCAYAGTSNTSAVQKLLKFAVTDVSDDVKRGALTNLGFLLFKKPQMIPETVKHLAESYNPHLRYGAAMAVGIGCAGTGLHEALKLLAPLTNDSTDFVRQGALIALSLVFVQITEAQEPKVATIKKLLKKMTEDKHEDILSRMGSILATGIINSGGRNATISLTTRDGNLRQNAVVGMVLFLQHWYWYPLLNFITLAMTPTALIAVNSDLKVPKSFKFVSDAKPSTFKYPELLKKDTGKVKEKVETAVLSTTAKVKARVDRKNKADHPDVEMAEGESAKSPEKKNDATADKEMADSAKKDEENKDEEKKEGDEIEEKVEEPTSEELSNPSRVLKAQEKKIIYLAEEGQKYEPVLKSRFGGFVVLRTIGDPPADEQYYDDEERNLDAPNPDLVSDMDIPAAFEFDPEIQNAP